jgi:hypothetical protein
MLCFLFLFKYRLGLKLWSDSRNWPVKRDRGRQPPPPSPPPPVTCTDNVAPDVGMAPNKVKIYARKREGGRGRGSRDGEGGRGYDSEWPRESHFIISRVKTRAVHKNLRQNILRPERGDRPRKACPDAEKFSYCSVLTSRPGLSSSYCTGAGSSDKAKLCFWVLRLKRFNTAAESLVLPEPYFRLKIRFS